MNKQKATNQANAAGHVDGNNILCTKIYRLNVQLFLEAGSGAQFGRYYFPEVRELNGKEIVGINVNIGGNAATSLANIVEIDTTNFAQGISYTIADDTALKSFFVNIYNDKKILIMENFPALQLADWNSLYGSNRTTKHQRKIYPLNTKLNIRECYIFGDASLAKDNLCISMNFYYN